jgi:uncharacterized protein with HEPN domain
MEMWIVQSQLTKEQFMQNIMLQDAFFYNLVAIGEAAGIIFVSLSNEWHVLVFIVFAHQNSKLFPEIDWHNIILIRNNAIHKYFDRNLEFVWKISQQLIHNYKGILISYLQKPKAT